MEAEYQKECESLKQIENTLKMKRKLVFEKNQQDLMHEDQCLEKLNKEEKTLYQKIESIQQKQDNLEAAIEKQQQRNESVERLMQLQCKYQKTFNEREGQLCSTHKKLHDLMLQRQQRDSTHADFVRQSFCEVEHLQNKWHDLRQKHEQASQEREKRQRMTDTDRSL